jgi:DNA-binding response OmpR family regulator
MTQLSPSEGSVRVVIVESHDGVRDLWGTALMLGGFAVRSFAHPADALADVAWSPPQIVVTDIALPGMPGDDFARTVRAACPASRPVLVAVTSLSRTLRTDEVGLFDRVLVKPIEGEQLVAELRALVGDPKPGAPRAAGRSGEDVRL